MTISCQDCPLRARSAFKKLSAEELAFMSKFKMGELQVDAGAPVVLEGSKSPHFHTVLAGSAIRTKTLADGRRQIVNFVFPGDLIGLQASMLGEMKHGVEAVTDLVLCVFSRERFWELYKQQSQRAYDVTWLAATESRSLGELLLSVGRRTAKERTAALLHFLMRRAVESGYARKEDQMAFPYRQQDLADAMGLSLVHTNKMLQEMRSEKLIQLDDGVLVILDREGLETLAMQEEDPDGEGRALL